MNGPAGAGHARNPGAAAAILAALLFGAGTPLAKVLLGRVEPWQLAGLFYLGSGLGLWLFRRLRHAPRVRLGRSEWWWFGAAVAAGGIAAPVLLMLGLRAMPAADASLLLNAESVFTALMAWYAFGENFDRRIASGMAAIVAGAAVLSWPGGAAAGVSQASFWPPAAVAAACFLWALDNNLTRKVSLHDAAWLAQVKGLTAGTVNLLLAGHAGRFLPELPYLAGALAIGSVCYGLSLALFVIGLRHLGTARTSAYFSVAPFFGAMLAVLVLHEPPTVRLLSAALLMAAGVWLHLTERHAHSHAHPPLEHDHEHGHDAHHLHPHVPPVPPGTRHRHPHRHEPLLHTHPHFPDTDHRHEH